MRRIFKIQIVGKIWLLAAWSCSYFFTTAQNKRGIEGHWEGGINRLGSIQVIRFDLYPQGDSLAGTFDVPAAAIFNATFFSIKKTNDTLRLNFGYGNFTCIYHADVNELTGVNTRWNPKLDLHMRKYGKKAEPAYSAEEVSYLNGQIRIAAKMRI